METRAPTVESVTSAFSCPATRRSAEALRETSAQVRERALRAQDSTVGYIRDEPMKAILIAAATGAALMALIGLMGRSHRRD